MIRAVVDRPYMLNIQGFGLPAPNPTRRCGLRPHDPHDPHDPFGLDTVGAVTTDVQHVLDSSGLDSSGRRPPLHAQYSGIWAARFQSNSDSPCRCGLRPHDPHDPHDPFGLDTVGAVYDRTFNTILDSSGRRPPLHAQYSGIWAARFHPTPTPPVGAVYDRTIRTIRTILSDLIL